VSHDETGVTFDVLFDPGAGPGSRGEAAEIAAADVYDFWLLTNAQDFSICERQQVGLTSPGFTPGRYAPMEEGVHEFDKIVAERYAEAG
jgi:Rieske 2Fe-2S family protein